MQLQSFLSAINSIRIPTSVQEALKDENWVRAMNEEMKALEKNETWEIVERPKDKKAVGCQVDIHNEVSLMARWINIKQGWLQKGTLKPMGSIMRKLLLQ